MLLPILTVIVTVWVAQLLQSYAGPNSLIGRLIVLLGLNLVVGYRRLLPRLSHHSGCIFLLGLVVETRLWPLVQTGLDSLISRVPLVSNARSVQALRRHRRPRRNKDSLQSMRPVWCFFGGEVALPCSG